MKSLDCFEFAELIELDLIQVIKNEILIPLLVLEASNERIQNDYKSNDSNRQLRSLLELSSVDWDPIISKTVSIVK